MRVSFADLGVPTDAKEPTPPSPRLGFSLSRCLAVCRGHGRERLLPTGLYEVGHQAEVLWPCHDPRRGPKKTDWSVWKRWVQDGVCVWVGWGGGGLLVKPGSQTAGGARILRGSARRTVDRSPGVHAALLHGLQPRGFLALVGGGRGQTAKADWPEFQGVQMSWTCDLRFVEL